MKHKPIVVTVAVLASVWGAFFVAYAQTEADEPAAMPWDNVMVPIGGVALAWGGVTAGLVQLLKSIEWNGRRLLNTSGRIWAANMLIGGTGMFIAAMQNGANPWSALIYAVQAILTASGAFEFVKHAVSKGSSGKEASPGDDFLKHQQPAP